MQENSPDNSRVIVVSQTSAKMPSRFGDFTVYAFQLSNGEECGAVVKGDVIDAEDVPTRLHSECFTGDLMGSLRCDCRDQLEAALHYIGTAERGAVIYLHQEGRGIGLFNKVRAYSLQDEGLDTVEANAALGFPDDLRDYDLASQIVSCLQIRSVRLLSNNPRKWNGLRQYGIQVSGRIPLQMKPNAFNASYLQTKREKSGHLL